MLRKISALCKFKLWISTSYYWIPDLLYLGLLIFVFYFTSKHLLDYQRLLVNTEQHNKKDLVCEQVEMI